MKKLYHNIKRKTINFHLALWKEERLKKHLTDFKPVRCLMLFNNYFAGVSSIEISPLNTPT